MVASIVACFALAAGPAAPAEPSPAPEGLMAPGNYAYLTPGIGGLAPIADATAFEYTWGVGIGHYFTAGKRFAAALGGFVEHGVLAFPPYEEGGWFLVNSLRLGPELRLGVRRPRVFAYGYGRFGVDMYFNYAVDETDYTIPDAPYVESVHKVYPWPWGALGGGAQFLLRRRLLLGAEGGVDIGGEAFFMLRARLLIGFRF